MRANPGSRTLQGSLRPARVGASKSCSGTQRRAVYRDIPGVRVGVLPLARLTGQGSGGMAIIETIRGPL